MLLGSDENIVHTFGFTFGRPTKDADKGYMLLLEVIPMLTNRCGRPRSSPHMTCLLLLVSGVQLRPRRADLSQGCRGQAAARTAAVNHRSDDQRPRAPARSWRAALGHVRPLHYAHCSCSCVSAASSLTLHMLLPSVLILQEARQCAYRALRGC